MTEIAQMTDPRSASGPTPSRRDGAEPNAFSYAFAAATLETRAGAALETFGARPRTNIDELKDQANEAPSTPSAAPALPPAAPTLAVASLEPPASAPPPGAASLQPPPNAAQPPAPMLAGAPTAPAATASVLPTPTGTTAGAAVRAPDAPSAPRPDAGRNGVPASAKAAARAPSIAPPRSLEAFAEILARRLHDGSSVFDLRLDPPALGRVEARLVLDPDGAARLALKFDNEAARDFFARDEAALRAALADTGFNLGDGALSFSLADDRSGKPGLTAHAAPEPLAPQAPGAALLINQLLIDIRI
jgi:flagellar hook-length control protein FliK